jgi:hypothetical protein
MTWLEQERKDGEDAGKRVSGLDPQTPESEDSTSGENVKPVSKRDI